MTLLFGEIQSEAARGFPRGGIEPIPARILPINGHQATDPIQLRISAFQLLQLPLSSLAPPDCKDQIAFPAQLQRWDSSQGSGP